MQTESAQPALLKRSLSDLTFYTNSIDNGDGKDYNKVGSGIVALEDQRYGRNKSTIVNKSYIDGGEYRRKFDNATDNSQVNKALYDCAKEALRHRSGTKFEDMYFIDGETGEVVAFEINQTIEQKIIYSKKTEKIVDEYDKNVIITIHTHPSSLPPSVSDFNSAYDHGYQKCFIACHDGKVFGYTSNQKISEELHNLYVDSFINQGCDEYNSQLKSLEKIMMNHDIYIWEVE